MILHFVIYLRCIFLMRVFWEEVLNSQVRGLNQSYVCLKQVLLRTAVLSILNYKFRKKDQKSKTTKDVS